MCVSVGEWDFYCKALWVINKTRKELYHIQSTFTILCRTTKMYSLFQKSPHFLTSKSQKMKYKYTRTQVSFSKLASLGYSGMAWAVPMTTNPNMKEWPEEYVAEAQWGEWVNRQEPVWNILFALHWFLHHWASGKSRRRVHLQWPRPPHRTEQMTTVHCAETCSQCFQRAEPNTHRLQWHNTFRSTKLQLFTVS